MIVSGAARPPLWAVLFARTDNLAEKRSPGSRIRHEWAALTAPSRMLECISEVKMRFDPRGWTYGDRSQMYHLARSLTASHEEADAMFTESFYGGGKAFGLRVCACLATHASAAGTPGAWRVPAWVSVPPEEQFRRAFQPKETLPPFGDGTVVVRSSNVEEDWLSGDSGREESTLCAADALAERFQHTHRRLQPVVVQRHADGIGIVLDLVWSRVLDRAVARVATGREHLFAGRRSFTSATWDPEGLIELRDGQNGDELVPAHHGPLIGRTVRSLPLRDLAREAIHAATSLGIGFGLQFEIVIHPDELDVRHLVQVRPTPNLVRPRAELRPVRTPMLATTPMVGGSFDLDAELVGITRQDHAWLLRSFSDDQATITAETRERFAGKIGLWEEPPVDSYWLALAGILASRLAMPAQIANGAIYINSTHVRTTRPGILARDPQREASWLATVRRSAILGILPESFEILKKLAHHSRTRLHLVSDGVVGQIAYADP